MPDATPLEIPGKASAKPKGKKATAAAKKAAAAKNADGKGS
jgi:hypothetical protein